MQPHSRERKRMCSRNHGPLTESYILFPGDTDNLFGNRQSLRRRMVRRMASDPNMRNASLSKDMTASFILTKTFSILPVSILWGDPSIIDSPSNRSFSSILRTTSFFTIVG